MTPEELELKLMLLGIAGKSNLDSHIELGAPINFWNITPDIRLAKSNSISRYYIQFRQSAIRRKAESYKTPQLAYNRVLDLLDIHPQ
jgi:hypothetical protein